MKIILALILALSFNTQASEAPLTTKEKKIILKAVKLVAMDTWEESPDYEFQFDSLTKIRNQSGYQLNLKLKFSESSWKKVTCAFPERTLLNDYVVSYLNQVVLVGEEPRMTYTIEDNFYEELNECISSEMDYEPSTPSKSGTKVVCVKANSDCRQ